MLSGKTVKEGKRPGGKKRTRKKGERRELEKNRKKKKLVRKYKEGVR